MRKLIMTIAVCFWAMSQMMAQNISGKIVDRGHKTKRINEREPENDGRT